MNPWRNFTGLASWVLRIALVLYIYTRFFGIFMQFNQQLTSFWVSAGFTALAVLLLMGGFLKQTLTVLAGLGIVILALAQIFITFNGITPALAQYFLLGAGGLYFLSHGNK